MGRSLGLLACADAVRLHAASNLGELSRMSPRVEHLANELATSAKSADPTVRMGLGLGRVRVWSRRFSGGMLQGRGLVTRPARRFGFGSSCCAKPSCGAQVRDAYLAALRGLLLCSGERLTPAVSASIGDALRDLARLVGASVSLGL